MKHIAPVSGLRQFLLVESGFDGLGHLVFGSRSQDHIGFLEVASTHPA
jgi:hypothetical protein